MLDDSSSNHHNRSTLQLGSGHDEQQQSHGIERRINGGISTEGISGGVWIVMSASALRLPRRSLSEPGCDLVKGDIDRIIVHDHVTRCKIGIQAR